MAQREQQEDDEREHHLHVGVGSEAEETHEAQLEHLAPGELVDLALGDASDVVIRRVSSLSRPQKQQTKEQTIT